MKNFQHDKLKIIIYVLTFFLGWFLLPKMWVGATSGACSFHDGVNCSMGRQTNGNVYCNDGWTDSMVEYDFMAQCESDYDNKTQYYYDGKIVDLVIEYDNRKEYCPPNSTIEYQYTKSQYTSTGNLYVPSYCVCNDGFYNYQSEKIGVRGSCEKGEPYVNTMVYLKRMSDEAQDFYLKDRKINDEWCKLKYGNSILKNNHCECAKGYRWMYGAYEKFIYCVKRDDYDTLVKSISDPINTGNKDLTIQEEKSLAAKIDKALSKRVSGNILLQVEKNGEGWYVNPDNQKKYYLGRPLDAFSIMKNLGLGIKHGELENYLNSKFPSRLSGKIMLDVEQNGEAYYVHPKDLKGYFLNRPSDAFKVMRELGLGITNGDIRKIEVGEIE